LPEANLYYQQGVVDRFEAAQLTRQEDGPIDAAFIGSSIVRTNVDPLEFDRRLEEGGARPFVSFNCGLSGLAPYEVRLYLKHRWFDVVQPRIVFQGIRLAELSAASDPMNSRLRAGQLESLWLDDSDPWGWREAVLSHVGLLHYRGEVFQTLRRFQDGKPFRELTRKQRFAIDRRGHQNSDQPLSAYRMHVTQQGKSVVYGDNTPLEAGFSSTPQETGFSILSQTIRDCRERGISYVLVNMPEHGERYPGADGEQRYRQYIASLQRFADAEGVPFIDVTAGEVRHFQRDEWYSDFHHLNAEGARCFSRMLADAAASEIPDQLRHR
jgi:hypothetical protein